MKERVAFMRHSEVDLVFQDVFPELVRESDRGAVLIGASHVDMHLERLFIHFAPDDMTAAETRQVLRYPGPVSSLAARTNVAYLTGPIPQDVRDSIDHLRQIRNKVAHSEGPFRLAEHETAIRRIYELGPGVPVAINRWANDIIVRDICSKMMDFTGPLNDDEPMFKSGEEAIDFLIESPDALEALEAKRPRFELGLGVAMLCGMIIFHRERDRSGDAPK